MNLINMEWLEALKSRRTEIRVSPDLGIIALRRDGPELEIHMVFVCD